VKPRWRAGAVREPTHVVQGIAKMSAYRSVPESLGGSVEEAFVRAVLGGRADRMEDCFARLRMPSRGLPRSHLFLRVSPRVSICWRPTSGDFLLSWISRETLAGPWRIALDDDVLGYAFDERISWVRDLSDDELALLRACRVLL
jgi:hypothetical protein